MATAPSYLLPPIEKPHSHGCLNCNHMITATFPMDGLIAVGFGYAGVTKDGLEVLREPDYNPLYDDSGDLLPEDQQPPEEECPIGADAEKLADADPDHDWRIVLHGPLSGRTYQRHGPENWVMVEQDMGFA